MRHVLVTGAAGFIASRICDFLLDAEDEVTGIDILNDIYDRRLKEYRINRRIGRDGFRFYKTDITDFGSLEKLFSENRFDAVINIAGIPGVRLSMKDPWLYLNVNTGSNAAAVMTSRNLSWHPHPASTAKTPPSPPMKTRLRTGRCSPIPPAKKVPKPNATRTIISITSTSPSSVISRSTAPPDAPTWPSTALSNGSPKGNPSS